ncbi:hypothetical protein B0H15DRAFT_942430 [Mycena belliarum]|uniref:Uncharacterized protein n=1 Tax=Mycena belliarum TaxID=1033014 RepID=A0AAD6XV20_9AGAR|nr:hypothetical protein B0H15DRAFT_942430 [Mycena belliae]
MSQLERQPSVPGCAGRILTRAAVERLSRQSPLEIWQCADQPPAAAGCNGFRVEQITTSTSGTAARPIGQHTIHATSPLTALVDFLSKPALPGVTDPPALPPDLDYLPDGAYIDAALAYVASYPFERRGYNAPRIREPEPYDASKHQLNFVRSQIINRRWALEEVASQMQTLLQRITSCTRTVSDSTPMNTGLPRKPHVVEKAFGLIEALAGIKTNGWDSEADRVENAFLTRPSI